MASKKARGKGGCPSLVMGRNMEEGERRRWWPSLTYHPSLPFAGPALVGESNRQDVAHINTTVYNVLWKDNTGEIPVIIYGDHRLICHLKIKEDKNDFLKKGGGYFALASLLSME